jgi:hypothetical protein
MRASGPATRAASDPTARGAGKRGPSRHRGRLPPLLGGRAAGACGSRQKLGSERALIAAEVGVAHI